LLILAYRERCGPAPRCAGGRRSRSVVLLRERLHATSGCAVRLRVESASPSVSMMHIHRGVVWNQKLFSYFGDADRERPMRQSFSASFGEKIIYFSTSRRKNASVVICGRAEYSGSMKEEVCLLLLGLLILSP